MKKMRRRVKRSKKMMTGEGSRREDKEDIREREDDYKVNVR